MSVKNYSQTCKLLTLFLDRIGKVLICHSVFPSSENGEAKLVCWLTVELCIIIVWCCRDVSAVSGWEQILPGSECECLDSGLWNILIRWRDGGRRTLSPCLLRAAAAASSRLPASATEQWPPAEQRPAPTPAHIKCIISHKLRTKIFPQLLRAVPGRANFVVS